ncbi:MAG: SDR family NAD(P)-dependent oxidoreductase [Victivallales bacterium]|nr:SDR family NAD(P)-dependent oxidoreductase [Victivallales bacterium]
MAESFKDKVVLITGASQGIGAVIAKVFAAEGCYVYVNCAHGVFKAQAVVEDICADGGKAELFQCDISNETEIAEKFKTLKPVDILINNARLNPYSKGEKDTEGSWFEKLLQVNLVGQYLVTLALIEGMKARRWGRIINVSSIQAHVAVPRRLMPYAAAKAGLNALTRCLAIEVAPYNVTVNTVSPGMVATENLSKNLTDEEVEERNQRIPLRRGATTLEIAECVLNTAKSSYMTGEIVNVNGGLWLTP